LEAPKEVTSQVSEAPKEQEQAPTKKVDGKEREEEKGIEEMRAFIPKNIPPPPSSKKQVQVRTTATAPRPPNPQARIGNVFFRFRFLFILYNFLFLFFDFRT
jgi:hypothetical protein